MSPLVELDRALSASLSDLRWDPPVACVYNPLTYAHHARVLYFERYGTLPKRVLFVGLNPGPFGMVQSGIPFGDVHMVREYLGINARISAPPHTHPKRPVLGFACKRPEISGRRFWGWIRKHHPNPHTFFSKALVWNWCPLAFFDANGRNLTPDRLRGKARFQLFEICDHSIITLIDCLQPAWVIGVGKFVFERIRKLFNPSKVTLIPHPSPANPASNRGWESHAEKAIQLFHPDLFQELFG
ncbi:MAG: hypothetical protein RMJ84_09485 [Sandaracinaceae bacterium]|nr:hypothetical protein [Sandaracinaceae bacterium]